MDANPQALRAPPARPGLDGECTARQALQRIAHACAQEIQAQEPRLRRSRSPDALHQIRVALRRWRTALIVFGPASSASHDRTKANLKWLARELNDARDLDVFAEALEPYRANGPGETALWAGLEAARDEAYAKAAEALQSDRLRRLLWRTAQAGRPGEDRSAPARAAAAEALQHRWRTLKRRGRRLGGLGAEARHKLRIEAKKVRYAVDLCGELFGHPRRQRRMARALQKLQDALGVLNDLAVGEVIAMKLARSSGEPDAAFAAGRLAGVRAGRERASVLKAARAVYEGFRAVDRFWAGALAD